MYVIKNAGRYVAREGSASSFTNRLEHAQTYPTREEAQRNACGNETVVAVADILGQG